MNAEDLETAQMEAGARRVLAGRYELHECIGQGGFGSVYRAGDRNLRRIVAVKLLRNELRTTSELVQRFEREALVLARLDAPEIVPIYDYGTDGDDFYIVMPLVEGESLASRLARGPLEVDLAVDVARAVCRGLITAHADRIVHRDLKPSNIMLTPAGPRLLDFGISKQLDVDGLTQSVIIGTPMYMSPEQARGVDVDERSDLFSLGCILFEMLTGRRPFSGDTFADYVIAVAHRKVDVAQLVRASVPPELIRIVTRCLERNSDRRYQSADALLDDLEATDTARARADQAKGARPALKALIWPIFATAAVLLLIPLSAGNFVWQLGLAALALIPFLWVTRHYLPYLHWQYAVMLFSICAGSFILLGSIPTFAAAYASLGAALPLGVRRFIWTSNLMFKWSLVIIALGTAVAPFVLRKHGYLVVRVLNAAPSRIAAFLLAIAVMVGVGLGYRVMADGFISLLTRERADRELLSARDEALPLVHSAAPVRQAAGGLLDPRIRFGKLFLDSGPELRRGGAPADPHGLVALFERIPNMRPEPLDRHLGPVYRWWALRLADVPEAGEACRHVVAAALQKLPDDPDLRQLLAETELRTGRYSRAAELFKVEALRRRDVALAKRAVALLETRGRCAEARLFAKDFIGALIVEGAADGSDQLPNLLGPCRANVTAR